MALERGYDQRVGASAGPGPVLTSPAAQGAGIGAALEDVGQTAHRAQLQAYQAERQLRADSEAADVAHKLALARTGMDQKLADLRANAAPGGVGHVDAVAKAYDDSVNGILDGVTETSVLHHFQRQIDDERQNVLGREVTYQAGLGVAKTVDDWQRTGAVQYNRVFNNPTTLAQEMQQADAALAAMQGVDGNTKIKLRDDIHQKLTLAHLTGGDPVAGLAELHSGVFDYLTPEQRDSAESQLDVRIRQQEVAAKSAASMQKQDVSESVSLAIKQVDDGKIYDDGELAALERQAGTVGVNPSRVYDLQNARAYNKVRTVYRNAAPNVIADELNHVNAQIAQAGAKAPDTLIQYRNNLAKTLERRRAEVASDQAGWAAQNGLDVPAIDWVAPNPDAIAQRRKAVEVAANTARVAPQYFTKDEVAQFRGVMDTGKAGTMDALRAARAFGPGAAVAAARQLAPNDNSFPWLAQISEHAAGLAVEGRWHLRTNPKAATLDKSDSNYSAYKEQFDRQDANVLGAMRYLDPQDRAAIMDSARNIVAGLVGRGETLTPSLRLYAINEALGATGPLGENRKGGLGRWGASGPYYVRPETMTSREFESRASWQAQQTPPINPDGSKIDLRLARPIAIGGGQYRFEIGGRPVRTKDGVFVVRAD